MLLATYVLAVKMATIRWIYFLARLCLKLFDLINVQAYSLQARSPIEDGQLDQ